MEGKEAQFIIVVTASACQVDLVGRVIFYGEMFVENAAAQFLARSTTARRFTSCLFRSRHDGITLTAIRDISSKGEDDGVRRLCDFYDI